MKVLRILFLSLILPPSAQALTFTRDIKDIYADAKLLATKQSPVFFTPNHSPPDDILYFTVEIPKGSPNKFEMRTSTGQLILDRVLCPRTVLNGTKSVQNYPIHYGFSSGRFSSDQDPLDLVVFGGDDRFENMVKTGKVTPQAVRVIGLMLMEECDEVPCKLQDWSNDWKVVGVLPEDPIYGKVRTMKETPAPDLEALTEFFANYKGAKNGHPQTRVTGYMEKDDAVKYIKTFKYIRPELRTEEQQECNELYSKLLKNQTKWGKASKPEHDKQFLICNKRVFFADFFKDQKTLEFYLNYSAYQLLYKQYKDKRGFNLSTAIDHMESLKRNHKAYYRFVGYDRPSQKGNYASQGSGQLILEWVKTKDRNKGCPDDFPPQHYDSSPIVDL